MSCSLHHRSLWESSTIGQDFLDARSEVSSARFDGGPGICESPGPVFEQSNLSAGTGDA